MAGGASFGLADLMLSYGVFRASLMVSAPLGIVAAQALLKKIYGKSEQQSTDQSDIHLRLTELTNENRFLRDQKRFIFLKKMGEGAQGITLLVKDRNNERLVVLKFPKERVLSEVFANVEGREGKESVDRLNVLLGRFKKTEALVMTKLDHSAIVKINALEELDVEQYVELFLQATENERSGPIERDALVEQIQRLGLEKIPCINMEYIEGENLSAELDARKLENGYRTVSLLYSVNLMERLLEALTIMWSKGIIHRDIKSDNLILSKDGLKLVDFGVSKYVVKSSETMTGAIIGTYAYMSPEQMYGEKATWQSDLYSAGVVFWEMLTGNTAVTEVTELISGETRPERMNLEKETASIKKYLRGNPDLLGLDLKELEAATVVKANLNVVAFRSMMGKMQASIIKRLEHILKKMLANEVERRYSDPNALKNDIAQLKALCQNYRDGTAVLLGIKGLDELPAELRVTQI